MNLLNDHRDQDWVPVAEETLIAAPKASDITEEKGAAETIVEQPLSAADESFKWEYDKKPKKSVLVPFAISFAVLLTIIIVSYGAFKYLNREKPVATMEPPAQQTPQPQQQTPAKPAETPATTTPAQQQQTQPAQPSAPMGSAQSAVARTADNMNKVLTALSGNVRLNTLIMDVYSFSVEVSAPSSSEIQAFVSSLKSQIPARITTSSPAGGRKALVSGMFSSPVSRPSPPGQQMSRAQIRREITRAATTTGVSISDLSVGDFRTVGNIRKAPIFVKVKGSISNCQRFFNELARLGDSLGLSKIIMMAPDGNQANFVLRLELLQ